MVERTRANRDVGLAPSHTKFCHQNIKNYLTYQPQMYRANYEPLRIFWNENATTLTWVLCMLPTTVRTIQGRKLGIQSVGGNTHGTRVKQVASLFQKILGGLGHAQYMYRMYQIFRHIVIQATRNTRCDEGCLSSLYSHISFCKATRRWNRYREYIYVKIVTYVH